MSKAPRTDAEGWIFSSPSRTLDYAYTLNSSNIREPRYHLWNLKRLGWSDERILEQAPHYHNDLVKALKSL